MNEINTTAMICLDDDFGFTYRVSKIEYILREDDSSRYIFTPNYSVIDLLTNELFQGIPGLKLEIRKPQYVRENITPVFISERTPGENREELWKLLEDSDMSSFNRLEWLIRTNTRYGGDRLYAVRWSPEFEKHIVNYKEIEKSMTRSAATMAHILRAICAGDDIYALEFMIDDSNRKAFYALLLSLYKKEKSYIDMQRAAGIQKSATRGKYSGRLPLRIDDTKLNEVIMIYRQGRMTAQEAADVLGVSRRTFFRKVKALLLAAETIHKP